MGEFILNLPFDEYAAIEAVSSSTLKHMRRSPLHFLNASIASRMPASPAKRRGTITHAAILEPKRFAEFAIVGTLNDNQRLALDAIAEGREVAVFEGKVRNGKAWEAFRDTHQSHVILTAREWSCIEHLGSKTPISAADYDLAKHMRESVMCHRVASTLLESGAPEVSMLWDDAGTGVDCKGRADWLSDGREGLIVGLKTTARADQRAFSKQAAELGYHIQWAMYCDAFTACFQRVPRVVEIVVESVPPHDVVVYEITDETLCQGRLEYGRLLERVKQCVEADHWPGISDEIVEFALPPWALDYDNVDLTLDGEVIDG